MLLSIPELKTYRKTYNALPDDVEAAYDAFDGRSDDLTIIRGALRIIKEHEAHDYLGLFLLHRHFPCAEGSIFVERRYTPRKGHAPVLVTQQETLGSAPRRAAGHRFGIRAGQFQPLEFTTDATAVAAAGRLAPKAALAEELGDFLKRYGADATLGVGIFQRTGTMGQATSVFLEETNFTNRTSVVHLLPHLPHQVGRAIPTLWTYGENAVGCCRGQCVAYCSHAGGGLGYCGHRHTGSHMICV
jgi:hypothetical protein